MPADSNECGTRLVAPRPGQQGADTVDFRNGDEPTMAELDAMMDDAATAPTPAANPSKEAGARPAVTMTEKSDAGSADLVDKLGADALAGHATVPDQEGRTRETGQARSDEPRRLPVGAFGLARAHEGLIVSAAVVHDKFLF